MWDTDPVEARVAHALKRAGYEFEYEKPTKTNVTVGTSRRIDFYVPSLDLWIECKRFWTSRTERQLHGLDNVLLIQGLPAAIAFEKMICKE